MPEIGQTISHYKIIDKLGAGGMGVVYRAEDTNLNRQVAIKALPDIFSGDPERMARFEREAKLLASLNHPNIATIYGLEQAEGKRFLAMELAEGETLAQQIERGPLPVDEALEVCCQVAEGLEAAHEKGVIHRDLKPANVKITPEGKVKILDFGLAKAFQGETPVTDASKSPTLTDQMTRPGVILGTAAYMSPEQAKGKAVDKRTDIWAFGCVLYECLTGKRAFEGETVTEMIAAVLKGEPDWDALPASTPWKARDLIHRCLMKDLRERLHDIGDARIEIAEASAATIMESGARATGSRIKWSQAIPLLLGAALVGAVSGALILWKTIPSILGESATRQAAQHRPAIVQRFTIGLPEQDPLAPVGSAPLGVGRPALALSPDGMCLVYAGEHDGETQLYVRRGYDMSVRPMPNTRGAYNPFFSPDGKSVGFFVGNQLKKISLEGGQPEPLCEATNCYGATWAENGNIYFAPQEGAVLCSVSQDGGPRRTEAVPDASKGIAFFAWPHALPGGKGILFANGSLSLPAKELKRLFKDREQIYAPDPRYLTSGHIVYSTNGSLIAAPFDLDRLEPTGSPKPVLDGVRTENYESAQCTISAEGMLVFVPGQSVAIGRPAWIDRRGKIEVLPFRPDKYGSFRISPDGTKLAISIRSTSEQIWICDHIQKGSLRRLSTEENEGRPIWTPKDSRITFSASEAGSWNIFWRPSDRSSKRESLIKRDNIFSMEPDSWSRQGDFLSYSERGSTGYDVIVHNRTTKRSTPFLYEKYDEWGSAFSPDGRWIAYTSDESGDYEVYLQEYPQGRKITISTGGGNEEPVWSKEGRELFYRNGRRWLCASDPTNPNFVAANCQVAFRGDFINVGGLSYDTSDGERFLVLQSAETSRPTELHVILNWFEELKRLVPTGKK